MLDITSLEKEFNVEEVVIIHPEVEQMRDRIKNLEQYEDPNEVLKGNIERANALLDRIETLLDNPSADAPRGGAARLMEVAGTIINAVTTAATSMMSMTFNDQDLEYKGKVLSLKELEVQAKIAGTSTKQALTQTNNNTQIIVADRNAVLDMLKGGHEISIPIETNILSND